LTTYKATAARLPLRSGGAARESASSRDCGYQGRGNARESSGMLGRAGPPGGGAFPLTAQARGGSAPTRTGRRADAQEASRPLRTPFREGGTGKFAGCDPEYGGQACRHPQFLPRGDDMLTANLSFRQVPGSRPAPTAPSTCTAGSERRSGIPPASVDGTWSGTIGPHRPALRHRSRLHRTRPETGGRGPYKMLGHQDLHLGGRAPTLTDKHPPLVLARCRERPAFAA